MLELLNVSKEFVNNIRETVPAISDISLSVSAGDFISIVGPSGSGKSTLLFIIGALMNPTEGDVLFRGRNIYETSPSVRAKISMAINNEEV